MRPLILVTNDDGMFAPGIRHLVEVVREFGEVVVVAPNSPQSAKGHAVTMNEPLRLNKVNVFDGIDAWECSGTPVDCVKLAKHVILKGRKIDICVSGINHGSNASINIIYSGTMSAAMEASLEGIKAIGFSQWDFSFDANFEPIKSYIRELVTFVLDEKFPKGKLLNVNFPNLKEIGNIKGMKLCRQANGHWKEAFQEGIDPMGKKYYWLTGKFVNEDKGEDTDIWALKNGFVSIVPSGHDLTDYETLEELKGRI